MQKFIMFLLLSLLFVFPSNLLVSSFVKKEKKKAASVKVQMSLDFQELDN